MLFFMANGAPLWLSFLLSCVALDDHPGVRLQARDRRSADQHGVIPLVIATLGLSIAVSRSCVRVQRRGPSFPSPFPAGQFALGGINISMRTSARWSSPASSSSAADVPEQDGHRPRDAGRRAEHRAAKVLGINVKRMVLYVFLINAVLAVVAGAARHRLICQIRHGDSIGQKAFFAAIIGGFNQTRGALLGGVLIGILEKSSGSMCRPHTRRWALILFSASSCSGPKACLANPRSARYERAGPSKTAQLQAAYGGSAAAELANEAASVGDIYEH